MNDTPRSPSFEKFVTRGINPIGFVVVLLAFLFLPCVAMSSWEFPSGAEAMSPLAALLEVSSNGANMAVHQDGYRWPIVIRVLAICTLLAIAAGAGTAVARPVRRRSLYGAAAALGSGGLLVVTGLSAAARMESAAKEFLSVLFAPIPKSESEPLIDQAGDRVGIGAGFWIALACLALIAAMNLVVLYRGRTVTRFNPAEINPASSDSPSERG